MKLKQQKVVQLAKNNSKQKLKVQTIPKSELDDRWMQFKFNSKNLQPRSYHASSIYKHFLYIYGGYDVDKGILSDFYRLNLSNQVTGFKWEQLSQNLQNYPGKLKGHSCITYEDTLVIFGGQNKTDQNNRIAYIYHIIQNKWTKVHPNIDIPGLDSHSCICSDNKMFIYGGFIDKKAKYSTQIYEFDLKNNKWALFYKPSASQKIPEPRGNFGMVFYENYLWIFGGTNGNKTLNDLWRFSLKQKIWQEFNIKQHVPEPRRSHSMIVYKQYFYVFGGIQDVTKQKNDIYLFDLKKKQWNKIMNSSNLIYQCSPTIKNNRSIQKKKTNSPKKIQNKISLINANSQQYKQKQSQLIGTDKTQVMKRILQQNKQKKFLQKKHQLLKQFTQITIQKQKRKLSPTSQNLIKTLQIIGDQEQSKKIIHKQVLYDPTGNFIVGKKPCARDAQTAALYNDKMLIFGGDRHLMSFSDLYYFDLNKGIESKKYYQDKK